MGKISKLTPILYKVSETDFNHNGLGQLHGLLVNHIEEVLNGEFEAYFELPAEHELADKITEKAIIKAKPNRKDNPTVFRVYDYEIDTVSGNLLIYARHKNIDDLNSNLILDVNINNRTPEQAWDAAKNNAKGLVETTFSSNVDTRSSTHWQRQSLLSAVAGKEGSIIQHWGGEIKHGNNWLWLYRRRGEDNVTTIRHGKNLAGLQVKYSTRGLVTAIVPYHNYHDEDESEDGIDIYGNVVESEYVDNYPHVYYEIVEYTHTDLGFNVGEKPTKQERITALNNKAKTWFGSSNNRDLPSINITVQLEDLSQTKEYEKFKNFEQIEIGDTVTVYSKRFGVKLTAKVRRVVYDGNLDKNVEVELGQAARSIYDDYKDLVDNRVDEVEHELKEGIDHVLVSANGKNKNYFGTADPNEVGLKGQEGDLYFRTNGQKYELWIFKDGQWVLEVGDLTGEEIRSEVEQAQQEAKEAIKKANEAVDYIENEIEGKFEDIENDLGNIVNVGKSTRNYILKSGEEVDFSELSDIETSVQGDYEPEPNEPNPNTLNRAKEYELTQPIVGGQEYTISVESDSEEDFAVWLNNNHFLGFMDEHELTFSVEDYSNPIVSIEEEIEEEVIEYDTVEEETSDLLAGETEVKTRGRNGLLHKIYEVITFANGQTTRTFLREEIVTKPRTEVILVGTGVLPNETYEDVTTTEEVDYETVYEDNSELEIGTENKIQDGVKGERTIVTRIYYVDDVETHREEISNEITTNPQNEIIEIGTKEPETEVNPNLFRESKEEVEIPKDWQFYKDSSPIPARETVTVSFDAISTNRREDLTLRSITMRDEDRELTTRDEEIRLSRDWERYSFTFDTDINTSFVRQLFYASSGTATIRKVKIELGDEDTGWIAHIDDGTTLPPEETFEDVTSTESVPFETEYEDNPDLPIGEESRIQRGRNGERTIVTRIYYIDGVEDRREEISNEITTQPTPEIIEVGTKEPLAGNENLVDDSKNTYNSYEPYNENWIRNGTMISSKRVVNDTWTNLTMMTDIAPSLKNGDTFTVSGYITVNGSIKSNLSFRNNTISTELSSSDVLSFSYDGNTGFFETTMKAIDRSFIFHAGTNTSPNDIFEIDKLKIELGSEATPFAMQRQTFGMQSVSTTSASVPDVIIIKSTRNSKMKNAMLNKGKRAEWSLAPEETLGRFDDIETVFRETVLGFEQTITQTQDGVDSNLAKINQTINTVDEQRSTIASIRTDVDGKVEVTEYNTLVNTVDHSIRKIENNEGKISQLEQNVDGFQSTVAGKADQSQVTQLENLYNVVVADVDDNKAQIGVLSDNINLRVEKGDVINQINISDESIIIDASKVHVGTHTTFDNGIITDRLIAPNAQIDGAKIADATIGSAKIANIDAGKIVTGTLKGVEVIAEIGQIAGLTISDYRLWREHPETNRYSIFKGGGDVLLAAGALSRTGSTTGAAFQLWHDGSIRFGGSGGDGWLFVNEDDNLDIQGPSRIVIRSGLTLFDGHLVPVTQTDYSIGRSEVNRRWFRVYVKNAESVSSDARLKSKIQALPRDLIKFIAQYVKPKQYEIYGKTHFGYIAQDVERALYKYAVGEVGFESAREYMKTFDFLGKGESYLSLVYAEIAVLKDEEQNLQIKRLEKRIKELENAV